LDKNGPESPSDTPTDPIPLSERIAHLQAHVGEDRPPEPDGCTPFLDVFEAHPDRGYAENLAGAIVESWRCSELPIRRREWIVGTPRPARPFREVYSWGIAHDPQVLEHPAYAERADDIRRRCERVRPSLHPLPGDYVIAEGARRFGSAELFRATRAIMWPASFMGHNVPDYARLLRRGVEGIVADIAEHRQRHRESGKQELLAACETVYRGMAEWIEAYAGQADKLAADELSPTIRDELAEIAEACRAVAREPPRTLPQAAQLLWFHMLWDGPDSQGRVDQYLYPFFRDDLAAGRLDEASAFDVMASLWLKFQRFPAHHVALAGQTRDGKDAANDLTRLCLQVARSLHDVRPRVTIRVCQDTPEDLWQLGTRMWSEGMGEPTFFNDEAVVRGMTRLGVAVEDARDYAFGGCTEIQLCGTSNLGGEDADFNLAKCLELALNNGRCRLTGLQLGPETGDPRQFSSFERVWEAYRRQVEFFTRHCCELTNMGMQQRSACLSKLVRMPLIADCLERGLDPDNGGARYGFGEVMTLGIGITADSLGAIRELAFREKRVSMPELIDALEADFAGCESLRQMLRNDAPKYGNDDPEADELAVKVAEHFWHELNRWRTHRGHPYIGCVVVLGRNIDFGKATGATPDGRRAGQPLEGSIEPRAGVNSRGPTAMLRSAAKVPQVLAPGGVLCNVKVSARMMATQEQRDNVAAMVKGYFAAGGQQVMMTPVDSETLRQAQADPEAHRDLIVRVGGFSARFVELGPELQEDIIARSE